MADNPTNVVKLITALVGPIQDVENALQQLLTERTIDTATGVQLDVLGELVGQPRGGLGDDDYRRYLRARVATDRSTGVTEDLLAIISKIIGNPAAVITSRNEVVATWFARVDGVAVSSATMTALTGMLSDAVSGGVRLLIQTAPVWPGVFKFSGGSFTGPGFDNTISPGSGGQYEDVRSNV